jgi:hypothetical protein
VRNNREATLIFKSTAEGRQWETDYYELKKGNKKATPNTF